MIFPSNFNDCQRVTETPRNNDATKLGIISGRCRRNQRTFDPIVGNFFGSPSFVRMWEFFLAASEISFPAHTTRAVTTCRRIVRLPARATTSRGQEETGLTHRSMKLVNCGTTACSMRFLRKPRATSTIVGYRLIPVVAERERARCKLPTNNAWVK